jgi:hypothetical protein
MQGAQGVVAAALYDHPHGTELRVYFEPDDQHDVLQSYVDANVAALELTADTLRDVLREPAWWPLAIE